MAFLVDTHCHLAAKEFEADLPEVLSRAQQNDVRRIVVVGTDPESSKKSLEIAARQPGFTATAGIHPHDAAQFLAAQIWSAFESLAADSGFHGIGETGLDYYYEHSPREAQREMLDRHIALSKKLKRPLVLHCREAFADLLDALDRAGRGEAFGVIHCFTGNAEEAKKFLDRGFHISFSGILTFPSAGSIREACKIAPADRILFETDAPFLAPVPHRGRRNEPAFVKETLSKAAEIRGEDFGELAERTSKNAARLFQI